MKMEFSPTDVENTRNDVSFGEQNTSTNNFSKAYIPNVSNETAKNNTLDYAHLLSPEVNSLFLVLRLLISVPGIALHVLIIRMVRREERKKPILLGNVLRAQAGIYIFAVVFMLVNTESLIFYLYPAVENIGSWYCFVVEFIFSWLSVYTLSLSVLVAAMKYFGVVKREKVEEIGRKRVKNVFQAIYLITVTVVAALNSVSNGAYDSNYFTNVCWGIENDVSSSADVWTSIKSAFCYDREYEIETAIGQKASNIVMPFLRVICGGLTLIRLLAATNIIELFIYYRLLKHINRLYDQEQQKFPSKSEVSKAIRRRRHNINKIMHIIDYVIESGGHIIIVVNFYAFAHYQNTLTFRIIGSLIWFIVSIPIPIAFLINERRVKDTIMKFGWMDGLKSVFRLTSNRIGVENDRHDIEHPKEVNRLSVKDNISNRSIGSKSSRNIELKDKRLPMINLIVEESNTHIQTLSNVDRLEGSIEKASTFRRHNTEDNNIADQLLPHQLSDYEETDVPINQEEDIYRSEMTKSKHKNKKRPKATSNYLTVEEYNNRDLISSVEFKDSESPSLASECVDGIKTAPVFRRNNAEDNNIPDQLLPNQSSDCEETAIYINQKENIYRSQMTKSKRIGKGTSKVPSNYLTIEEYNNRDLISSVEFKDSESPSLASECVGGIKTASAFRRNNTEDNNIPDQLLPNQSSDWFRFLRKRRSKTRSKAPSNYLTVEEYNKGNSVASIEVEDVESPSLFSECVASTETVIAFRRHNTEDNNIPDQLLPNQPSYYEDYATYINPEEDIYRSQMTKSKCRSKKRPKSPSNYLTVAEYNNGDSISFIEVEDLECPSLISEFVSEKKETDHILFSKESLAKNTTLLPDDTHRYEKYFKCKDFVAFSRRKILHTLLSTLNNYEKEEVAYFQRLQNLNEFETYITEDISSEENSDLTHALVNAWLLYKNSRKVNESMLLDKLKHLFRYLFAISSDNNNAYSINNDRKNAVYLMLLHVSNEEKYEKHFSALNAIEKSVLGLDKKLCWIEMKN